jgi:hypothetical protein
MPRRFCAQGLEVLVAVMLARERCAAADAAASGCTGRGACTALAASLGTLPSGLLEMVADAVAALGVELYGQRPSGAAKNLSSRPEVQRPSWAARNLSSPPEVQRPSGAAPKRERVPMRITAPDGRVSPCPDPLYCLRTVGNAHFPLLLPVAQSLGCRW